MASTCIRCRTSAATRQTRKSGRTKIVRYFRCGVCNLRWATEETIKRDAALDAQLTPEQRDWAFGKPKFRYKISRRIVCE